MPKQNTKIGFSLVELMVVISIIGMLSAVGVPMYRKYTIKTKIATGISIIQLIAKKVIESDLDESNTITYAGTTITAAAPGGGGAWIQINVPPLDSVNWQVSSTTNNYMLEFTFSGLTGIPGYVEPNGNYSSYSSITYTLQTDSNGNWSAYCGQYAPGDTHAIPVEYLPPGCQCTNSAYIWDYNETPSC